MYKTILFTILHETQYTNYISHREISIYVASYIMLNDLFHKDFAINTELNKSCGKGIIIRRQSYAANLSN